MTRFRWSMVAAVITVSAQLVTIPLAGAAWDHAHGDSANTGFARVDTAAAGTPHQVVQLGRLAAGAGPVIGPNGMLYIGNLDSGMLVLQPDGTIASRLTFAGGGAFLASPVAGADGSVYWVSVTKAQTRDPHGTEFTRYDSLLNKRTADNATGIWAVHLPVAPVDPPSSPALAGWPVAAAPPSMWRSGATEVVVMPVLYRYPSAAELRLLAFSTESGTVLGNKIVSSKVFDVTGSGPELTTQEWVCALLIASVAGPSGVPCLISYNSPIVCGEECLRDTSWPMPGVAIAPDPGGGPPSVIVSDELRQDAVGYRFDPATGFTEAWRVHDATRTRTSAPTVLPDRHVVMLGTQEGNGPRGGVSFAGPQGPVHDRRLPSQVVAPPTRLADGREAVVEFDGHLTLFRGGVFDRRVPLMGQSIASPAASCTHVFVASALAFTTYDARTLTQVAQVPWSGGGRSSPVIGPTGFVYAIMHAVDRTDTLFVWPPPKRTTAIGRIGTACDRVVTHPQP